MTTTTITAATSTTPFRRTALTIDSAANARRRTTPDAKHAVPAIPVDGPVGLRSPHGEDPNAEHHGHPLDRWRGAFTRGHRSRRPRPERWMLIDPTQMMLAVWMDHLADGHSTVRLRTPRASAMRPLPNR